jgi:hypothetical protein
MREIKISNTLNVVHGQKRVYVFLFVCLLPSSVAFQRNFSFFRQDFTTLDKVLQLLRACQVAKWHNVHAS